MGKISHFSKRNRTPILVVIVNLLILFGGAITLKQYAANSNNIIKNVANAGAATFASMLDEQLKNTLYSKQRTLVNISEQLESSNFSFYQALTHLKLLSNSSGEMLLVNTESLVGNMITTDENGNSVQSEYSLREYEKELIMNISLDDWKDTELHISQEYWNDDKNQYELIIYNPVELEGNDYILMEFFSVASLITSNYSANNLMTIDHCSIINYDGDLLFGDIRGINIKEGDMDFFSFSDTIKDRVADEKPQDSIKRGDIPQEKINIYDYFEEQNTDTYNEIRKKLETGENGYLFLEEDEQQYLCTYYYMKTFPRWIIFNRVEKGIMSQGGDILKIVLSAAALILSFLGCNMAIIFYQNVRLRKMLVIQEKNNVELEKANKAQQVFISSMSHEIRTPINAVLGMDEMIIRETSEEEIKQYAYDIKNAGKTLLGIVNDILDFTKIQSGKMDIIPQDYELASLINDLLNLVETRAKEKNLEVILDLNQDIPHLLLGDDIRIKQIILNILTNAVKYTEKGSVTFKLDYEKKNDKEIYLKVSVKDTGIGMKPEEMDKLYKPFERLDEKRNRTIEGTGLGMSIVTNLLTQMDSKLQVSSVYGEGSEFSFSLLQPVVEWKSIGPLDRHYRDNREEKENEGILHAKRAKILVVDDTTVNLTVVVGLLKRTGVKVDTAESGFACLDMCRNKKYDVIFLDHRMPEMDGVETLHHLKEEEGLNQNTPTIALTANAISGAYDEYIKEGFQDFLSKPVNGNKLERMILKYLPKELLDTEDDLEIDDREGMKACGSQEVINQVRKEFIQTADKNRKEIATYLENGDIKNYTIKVHALKSSARLVGATKLSEEALYLENCGNAGNIEEILAKTSELLKHHEKVCSILKELNPATEQEQQKEVIDSSTLNEALEAMLEFNEAFDFDQVDSIIEELEKYRMPNDFEEKYSELKTAIYDVDQEKIKMIIQERIGSHGK